MANGKSPGEDASTVEFYKCFFDSLGQDLLNSFNATYELPVSCPSLNVEG